jgi:hypothetical protein
MYLQKSQCRSTILEVKGERSACLMLPQLFQGIVEDEDVVGHIRRDPQKRISMDSLQKQDAICDAF